MKQKLTPETPDASRPIKDAVTVSISRCADGSVRYEAVCDRLNYEFGYRGDWKDAPTRAGNVLHELAERRTWEVTQ